MNILESETTSVAFLSQNKFNEVNTCYIIRLNTLKAQVQFQSVLYLLQLLLILC